MLITSASRGGNRILRTSANKILIESNGLHIADVAIAGRYLRMRRYIETILIVLVLPMVIPIALGVAISVRVNTPGPILFRQRRVGQHGRGFTMYKFRSMVFEPQSDHTQTRQNDERITRVGQFIRRHRLDEIPQLYNVLRGEMSLVGPRPELESLCRIFDEQIDCYSQRQLVPPGITGWAQIQSAYSDDIAGAAYKLQFDLEYIVRASPLLDISILLRTVPVILSGFGAR